MTATFQYANASQNPSADRSRPDAGPYAAGDPLGCLVEVAHRAFAADRAVEVAPGGNAEALVEPAGYVLIAPAHQRDDVDGVYLVQEAAGV